MPEQIENLDYLSSLEDKLSKFSLNEYQGLARQTLRKHMTNELTSHQIFLSLGLCGEVGEVMELIKRVMEKRKTIEEIRQALEGELGDVLWHLSTLADTFNLTLEKLALNNLKKIRDRKLKGLYK